MFNVVVSNALRIPFLMVCLFCMFQRWINALNDHIGFATHFIHAGESQENEDTVPIATIEEAFQVRDIITLFLGLLWRLIRNILCGHFLSSADSRRAVVSFW